MDIKWSFDPHFVLKREAQTRKVMSYTKKTTIESLHLQRDLDVLYFFLEIKKSIQQNNYQ